MRKGSRFGVSCFVIISVNGIPDSIQVNKQPKRTASAFFFWRLWSGGRKCRRKIQIEY